MGKGFGARLKGLRDKTNLRQEDAAKRLGVARSTYAKYETNDSEPDHEMLTKLARLYDVSTDYLITGVTHTRDLKPVDPMYYEGQIEIPLLGSIRAGQPIEMIRESGSEPVVVQRELLGQHEGFALEVVGESMIGDYIFPHDIVIVKYTSDFSPSDICVVAINGDEATLKRVKQQGELCVLTPSNPAMEPMIYPAQDVYVIGVVVEIRRRPKR